MGQFQDCASGRGRSFPTQGWFLERALFGRKSLDRIQARGAEGRDHTPWHPAMKGMVTLLIEWVIDFAYCFAVR